MTDRSKVKTVTQVKNNQPCENKRQALSQIKRIDWTALDFRTKNQKSFYRTIGRNDVTFCVGPAGCGKTYLATHYALKNLAQGKYENMVITKLYGVKNIPITYLIDPEGVLLGRALGIRDWSRPELMEFIRSRLE